MKKIVFVFSILCFLFVMNGNAQKTPVKSQEMKISTDSKTELSDADKQAASRVAAADPSIVVRKKGKQVTYLRKVVDQQTREETLREVRYDAKSRKFVDVIGNNSARDMNKPTRSETKRQ